jgi:hypothetical protein
VGFLAAAADTLKRGVSTPGVDSGVFKIDDDGCRPERVFSKPGERTPGVADHALVVVGHASERWSYVLCRAAAAPAALLHHSRFASRFGHNQYNSRRHET